VLVFVVLGLFISVAFNTTSRLAEARPGRASDLVDVVQDMEQQRDELQNRLAELRADLARLEQGAMPRNDDGAPGDEAAPVELLVEDPGGEVKRYTLARAPVASPSGED
jgi:hypothetical protein